MEMDDFNQKAIEAAELKERSLDSELLPLIKDRYYLHYTCIKNLNSLLLKTSLISDDPYKNETKVYEIKPPENDIFTDSVRSIKMGARLGDYEKTLGFICEELIFTTRDINMEKIKKLLEFNSSFSWGNLVTNSPRINTRSLATIIGNAKKIPDAVIASSIKNAVGQSVSAISEIDAGLKRLSDFHKEAYKIQIRKKVLASEKFNKECYSSTGAFMEEVKRLFPECMKTKKSPNSELLVELANEETAPNRDEYREKLMKKFQIVSEKKEAEVKTENVHEYLMEAVRCVGTSCEQYQAAYDKIVHNNEIILFERNTFKEKFFHFLRNLFGLDEPPINYEIKITEKRTNAVRKEIVHYNDFIVSLQKRIKNYSLFSVKTAPGYLKINAQKDDAILDYLNRQISENNHLFAIIIGLDETFKTIVSDANKSKIKGCSMELTTLKNIFVTVNAYKAEYMGAVEEAEQMKKLGIQ